MTSSRIGRIFHLSSLHFRFLVLTSLVQSRYDKVTYSELKDRYLHNVVEISPPFTQAAKDRLNDNINRLLDLYAKCVTRGDENAARQQLRLHQRENIAWERDTVWRQMIGQQRRGEADTQDILGATLVKGPEPTVVDFPTPVGRFKITKRNIFKAVAVAVFILLLNVQVVEGEAANRCFAILSLCTILWATEARGLHCSSFSFFFFLIR
jgi:phosphate transporter